MRSLACSAFAINSGGDWIRCAAIQLPTIGGLRVLVSRHEFGATKRVEGADRQFLQLSEQDRVNYLETET